MPEKSLLSRLGDEIIDAHEQVASKVIEAASAMRRQSAGGDDGAADDGGATAAAAGGGVGVHTDAEDIMGMPDGITEEGMKSPLEGIAEHVMGDIFEGQMGPQTPWEHIDAFRTAINWTEPLLLGLAAFQLTIFLITILVIRRGNMAARFGLLAFIAIVTRCAERLNGYGAEYWESFATQNYFDGRGIFVLIMLCLPLLGDCVLMLFSFIREVSGLLVDVKQMELKKKVKGTATKKRDGGGGTDAASAAASGTKQRRGKKKSPKED